MWYRLSVALGLRLRVTNTQDRNMIERTFDRFPVRIEVSKTPRGSTYAIR